MKTILVTVLTFFTMYAFADVTLTEKTDGIVSVSYFSKNRVAVQENGQILNITDLKTQTIYGFNPENKTYFKATFKELADMNKAAMAEMDPEMMAQFNSEAGLKQPITIKKTGKGEYGGYQCDKYEVGFQGMPAASQICVSPQVRQLILNEIDTKALKSWLKVMDFEGNIDPIRTKLDEISEKVGYIIYEKTVHSIPGVPMAAGAVDSYTTVLQSVNTKPIDNGKFSVPAGYKKVSIAEAMGGEEQ
ncbi:hypothetical protein [Seleniivibrio woodruffii]|uniref:DUF4412 domain-containing protein n=1 Tax=Seleniivibrio woodruffii TaxID=1078050 RepID=A0A4R1K5N1_9BACT|nr:hypothetical protein [Seleniivibrio woodruffii]TCK59506.1 hypothetical protein C8D98_2440 [Seleniivibrio woodruffii]TVZ35453.1 hypothetical protein OF66_1068 [Seleniivibrio woodruffii]